MSASFTWCQDSGTQTGSPAHGTTRSGFSTDTHNPTNFNLKNVDDCEQNGGTAASASPIAAGSNSFTMYQYGQFGGSFTSIASGLFTHTAGTFGSGLTLKGTVTSTYTTPSATTNSALTTDMTSAISIGGGLAVLFSTTGPEGASPTSTLTAAGYTQYFPLQLQTASPAPGATASYTMTMQYIES